MKNRLNTVGFAVCLAGLALAQPAVGASNSCGSVSLEHSNIPSATNELLIHASRQQVWQAIRARRTSSACRKELSHTDNQAVVEEMFASCPIVGNVVCTYVEDETQPLQRIDYHMVDSNRLKRFEGFYLLKTAPDGVSTVLQLTSSVDPGIRIPFWQDIARGQASRSGEHTLHEIAALAGDPQ